MKKTLLLSALVVTATAFAATTGNFKVDTKHTTELPAAGKEFAKLVSDTDHEVKLSTEVNLGESGVTLGGDLTLDKGVVKGAVKEYNANVKYNFNTKTEGLKAYVKGNVGNAKLEEHNIGLAVKGEFEVSYEKSGITYSLNSNTKSNIMKSSDSKAAPAYESVATTFNSEHTLKIAGEKDKLKDVLLSFNLKHGYTPTDSVFVGLEGKGAIEVTKGLKVGAYDKFAITAVSEREDKTKGEILGEAKFTNKDQLANFFNLYAVYNTDSFEGTAKTIVEYRKIATEKLAFGEKLEANYKGVKNLQLKANALFAGIKEANLKGLVNLGVNIVYSIKPTDKLTITPDLGGSVKFDNLDNTGKFEMSGEIVPQLGVEYAVNKEVKLTSSVKPSVKFNASGYEKTEFETKLGLAYAW